MHVDYFSQCLVLVPTRELAQQAATWASTFGGTQIRHCCVYGGAPKGPQLRDIERGISSPSTTNPLDFVDLPDAVTTVLAVP